MLPTNLEQRRLINHLIEWAQNYEMIDQYYTEHGKRCLDAAELLQKYWDQTKVYTQS